MGIRDDVIAYLSEHECTAPFVRKRLLLRVRTATVEALNPTGLYLDLFDPTLYTVDDTTDYIYLRLFPDYDQENDNIGDGGLRNTFSSPAVYAPSTVRRGFRATITDRRKIILDIIRQLAEISKSSSYTTFAPIKVIDFCLPEVGTVSFGGELGSVRWGEIRIDNLPGLTGRGYLRADWNFTFKQASLGLI
ncbi:hypothetical protein ACX27_04340 [Nostoc piscinale CENA21]|uniref:Uncharacterized protein n=1 Tax=Nostoc piscinale CENA21 TaxID=224013 RepID=A0A0M4T049_9NOSO|nr:hypothetical protein [Nostoc piscinale]ALF52258.1 hypothetical protein ACX27_04340 [Nostoc piscinale CENA21]